MQPCVQRALCLAVTLASPSAVANELPEAAGGLLTDLERIVAAEEASGWFLEQEALRAVQKPVLESLCRTPAGDRRIALAALEQRLELLGRPRELYEQKGRQMDAEVRESLFVERQLSALRSGLARAGEDCPFWVEPARDFSGLQTDRNRFTLNLESGGSAQLRQTQDGWTLGGGGLLRVLGGYGVEGDYSLLAGIEFGGGAMLEPNTEPTEFVINYFPALPLVFRVHDVAWHYDFEAAPVALFQADNSDLSFGLRTAFGLGIAALRTRGVVPWAGAHAAYEYYVPSGGRAAQHFVRGGLRVGFIWDP